MFEITNANTKNEIPSSKFMTGRKEEIILKPPLAYFRVHIL